MTRHWSPLAGAKDQHQKITVYAKPGPPDDAESGILIVMSTVVLCAVWVQTDAVQGLEQ